MESELKQIEGSLSELRVVEMSTGDRLLYKMLGLSAKWPSAKWTECQVDRVPSGPSAKYDRVPSVTECQVDRVPSDRVPSVTECQVWPSAKCDRVPSMTECQVWPSAKYDQVPSVTECQVWPKAKFDWVTMGTKCQVWLTAKCDWVPSVSKCKAWLCIKRKTLFVVVMIIKFEDKKSLGISCAKIRRVS